MNTYLAGTLVRVATYSGTAAAPVGGFRDASGNLADPDTVTLKYRAGGVVTTVVFPSAPVVKDGAGLYHADIDTTGLLGRVVFDWVGAGAVQAAAVGAFNVTAAFP